MRKRENQMATTTITKTEGNIQRVIFNCKRCRHIWAKDYRKMRDARTGQPTGDLYYMVEVDGMRIRHWYGEDINGYCPKCNSLSIVGNRVVGTVTDHPCNGACMAAKGGDCECSCGGANHGKNHLS
jgi:hypothetical protein